MAPTPPKRRKRRKKDRRQGSTLIILFLMLGMVLPVMSGFAGAAVTYLSRYFSEGGPDCVYLRVIDGGRIRLHCRGAGLVSAELIGIDAPDIFQPKCVGDLIDGYQARFALQGLIWQAREIKLDFADPAPDGTRRLKIYLDGSDVTKTLVYRRHSRQDVFGRNIDRCRHAFGD